MNPLAVALLQAGQRFPQYGPGGLGGVSTDSAVAPSEGVPGGSVPAAPVGPPGGVPAAQNAALTDAAFRVGQLYGRGLGSGGYTYLGGNQWRGAQGRVKGSVGGPPRGPVGRGQVGMSDGVGGPVTPAMTLAALLAREGR